MLESNFLIYLLTYTSSCWGKTIYFFGPGSIYISSDFHEKKNIIACFLLLQYQLISETEKRQAGLLAEEMQMWALSVGQVQKQINCFYLHKQQRINVRNLAKNGTRGL